MNQTPNQASVLVAHANTDFQANYGTRAAQVSCVIHIVTAVTICAAAITSVQYPSSNLLKHQACCRSPLREAHKALSDPTLPSLDRQEPPQAPAEAPLSPSFTKPSAIEPPATSSSLHPSGPSPDPLVHAVAAPTHAAGSMALAPEHAVSGSPAAGTEADCVAAVAAASLCARSWDGFLRGSGGASDFENMPLADLAAPGGVAF